MFLPVVELFHSVNLESTTKKLNCFKDKRSLELFQQIKETDAPRANMYSLTTESYYQTTNLPTANMPRKRTTQGRSSKGQRGRVGRTCQAKLFQGLGIEDDTQYQATVLSTIKDAYNSVGLVDLRSSISRRKVRQAIRDRMDQMPAMLRDNEDREGVVEMLYRLILAVKASWNGETDQQSQQPQPTEEQQQGESAQPEQQRRPEQSQNQQDQDHQSQSVLSRRRTSSLTRGSLQSRDSSTPESPQSAPEQQNVSQEAIVEERAQHLDDVSVVPFPTNGSQLSSPQAGHPATQPTTGDKRRGPATENDPSERPPQRRLGSDSSPDREGLPQLSQEHGDSQRTSISSSASRRVSQIIPKTSRSHCRFRHLLAVEIKNSQSASRLPPTADEPFSIPSQERPGEAQHVVSNEVHGIAGHVCMPHDRFQPPEVQRALNSPRLTGETSQLTETIDLTGEVEELSSSIQDSAIEAQQKVALENERLAQEKNRQFSEKQQYPLEVQSLSSASQPFSSVGNSFISEDQLPVEENPWLAGQIHWTTHDMYGTRMTTVKRPPSISVSPRTRVGSFYSGQ